MLQYIVSLSLLIGAVLLIRIAFRKTVSPRVIYSLWLVVLVRLCLPISLFSLELPGQVRAETEFETVTAETSAPPLTVPEKVPMEPAPQIPMAQTPVYPTYPSVPIVITPQESPSSPAPEKPHPQTPPAFSEVPVIEEPGEEAKAIPWKGILSIVWISGSVLLAGWFLVTGLLFNYRLRRDRKLYQQLRKTNVYLSRSAGAPCLAGIFPSIYITPETAGSRSETLIIVHEYVHLCHLDHVWSLFRIGALVVHWWNPLVWAAAFISKQDSELACDDGVSAKLTEEKRFQYAHILLDTIPQQHRAAIGLGSAPMKERIIALTRGRRNRPALCVLAIVLCLCAVGCAFVGIREGTAETKEPPFSETDSMSENSNDQETSRLDPETEDPAETEPSIPLVGGESIVKQVEALPDVVENAWITAYPVGGNPKYMVFERGLQYYRLNHYTNEIHHCTLTLPEGYTDGEIISAASGAGSGEVYLYVEAWCEGERAWMAYRFDTANEDNLQPTAFIRLLGRDLLRQREVMSYRRGLSIYDCGDVYFHDGVETYGSASAWIPIALTDYELTDCHIFRCADLCDQTDLVNRMMWGYAGAYRIDSYESYTQSDGWKYPARRYINAVPDDLAAEMRSQGAPEDVIFPRKYPYLIAIDDNHYAFVTVTARENTPMPADEGAVVDEIVKQSLFTLSVNEAALSDNFIGALSGYLPEAGSDIIELYTERDGEKIGTIPFEVAAGFFGDSPSAGWMILRFYSGEKENFRWVLVCSPTAMGTGKQCVSTSKDGGRTWQVGKLTDFQGAVTGAAFLSETLGYISYQPFADNGPNIFRTTDGGGSWERLSLTVPDALSTYRLVARTPFEVRGQVLYPVSLCGAYGAEDEEHLVSNDGGLTWEWSIVLFEQRNQTVSVPLNDENREYLMGAATYGVSEGMNTGTVLGAGTDGIRYEVFGVGSHYKKTGVFSQLYTWRVESKDGAIVSIEEVPTVTKQDVLEKGTPHQKISDGHYNNKAISLGIGIMSRSVLIEGDRITIASYLDGTDAGGNYHGTYTYDPNSGVFSAELYSRTADGNGSVREQGPLGISGKLLSYEGFVWFVCEASELYDLTPDDPLPLGFVPNIDGSQDAEEIILSDGFGGEWYPLSPSPITKLSLDVQHGGMILSVADPKDGSLTDYTGTFTVNPFYEMTAELTGRGADGVSMDFTLGYVWGEDGHFLTMIIGECRGDSLRYLADTTLSFTHETIKNVEAEMADGNGLDLSNDVHRALARWLDLTEQIYLPDGSDMTEEEYEVFRSQATKYVLHHADGTIDSIRYYLGLCFGNEDLFSDRMLYQTGETYHAQGRGRSLVCYEFVGQTTNADGSETLNVVFYSDPNRLFEAQEVAYTVLLREERDENGNPVVRFLSSEIVKDYGIPPYPYAD